MTDSQKPLPPRRLPHHDSVDDLRRGLMTSSVAMAARSDAYKRASLLDEPVPVEDATFDAWEAATRAWMTSYVLAAVLGVAGKEFGAEVAHRLACVADEVLANGDGTPGYNADVTPEKESAR